MLMLTGANRTFGGWVFYCASLLAALLCVLGSANFRHVGDADAARVVVGNNKKCCVAPTYTSCDDIAPMKCTGSASCDPNAPVNGRWSDATCMDTGKPSDNCDEKYVNDKKVEKCIPTSTTPVECDGGYKCLHVTQPDSHPNAPLDSYWSCGTSTLCAS